MKTTKQYLGCSKVILRGFLCIGISSRNSGFWKYSGAFRKVYICYNGSVKKHLMGMPLLQIISQHWPGPNPNKNFKRKSMLCWFLSILIAWKNGTANQRAQKWAYHKILQDFLYDWFLVPTSSLIVFSDLCSEQCAVWAIYCTLCNFSKPVTTINLPKLPTF